MIALAILLIFASGAAADEGWQRSKWFNEKYLTTAVEPNIRIHVNAPSDDTSHSLDEQRPAPPATRLIVYALPNGNTIEQTLGCAMREGLDWRYDIQHVAAQVRLLRSLMPDERIVLLCVEAEGLSWPNWRRNHANANAVLSGLVADWRKRYGGPNARVTLTAHSGGGSLISGVIEATDQIPTFIDRIAELDANYSFDAALHAGKLRDWLRDDAPRCFIVIAYDDREITLDGKRVVGPEGGTYRATARTRDALRQYFPLLQSQRTPFTESIGLAGRVRLYVHENPENKILHTALVGEMNGLVHSLTLETPHEEKWGKFGGPRAYARWIQPEPTIAPSSAIETPRGGELMSRVMANMPPRPSDAVGGAEFIRRIASLDLAEREAAILREAARGNMPSFLRTFKIVEFKTQDEAGNHVTARLAAMPDYVSIGSDADFVRMPMTPQTAQQIADRFGCTLPTRKLVDAVDAAAELRLEPHPLRVAREAATTFLAHHQIIERQRGESPLGLLISGIKKDIVLSPRIFERADRLAIYGWRKLNGEPIQPLTIVHHNRYVDYSHGARLIDDEIEIDGRRRTISEILQDDSLAPIVSDEGVVAPPRYPVPAPAPSP